MKKYLRVWDTLIHKIINIVYIKKSLKICVILILQNMPYLLSMFIYRDEWVYRFYTASHMQQ